MKLTVSTSYFPVDADINSNLRYVLRHMRVSQAKGANVVHFPEACLSGYAGAEFKSYKDFDWKLLREATLCVMDEARRLKLWVILGSTHRLSGKNKPHNSLYIINDRGEIADRYDKLFCAGDRLGEVGDLAHYSSGNHFCTFRIRGVTCGALICHDYRYPELYRQYKRLGVQLMFHSYHAAHLPAARWRKICDDVGSEFHKLNAAKTIPGITMPATMQSMAANNYMWISCANSSARQCCWPSFFVRPDGVITGRQRLHITGTLITAVDTRTKYYDSTAAWRKRAMDGLYHSGKAVRDKRSQNRTEI
jgi:predicted amidohydrolase